MKKILLLITIAMLGSIVGYSQAPGIFNYQGVARNSVGNVLINQAITLRLTVHDGSAGGATVYQESRTVTTNPVGLFNVQVGSPGATNVTGTITGVNWGVGSKFIQVEIDPAGGTTFINIGTAQLASVPYSVFATTAGDIALPFNKTQADAGSLFKLTNSGNGAGSTALEGLTNSTAGSASAITGTVTNTSPGGFSAGIRGINRGTGGLGIGVWGSQDGSGWGVYGTAVGGIGVNGSASGGVGISGAATTGIGGQFSSASGLALNTNGALRLQGINEALNRILAADAAGNATWKDASAIGIITGTGTLNFVPKWTPAGTNLGNSQIFDDGTSIGIGTTTPPATIKLNVISSGGNSIRGTLTGVPATSIATAGSIYGESTTGIGVIGVSGTQNGVYGLSTGTLGGTVGVATGTGNGLWGVNTGAGGNAGFFEATNTTGTADGVKVNQSGLGRGVYGSINNTSNIVAAVRGETNGGGYGVFGQATGNANAGFFQISNPASTSSTVNVTTNGIGSGVTVQLTNASNGARGLDVLQAGVGPGVFATSAGGNAVWGITSSISAAGVIGDNTFGEAVVGRNRGGIGVGAVVGRNDSSGYGVRGFNTKNGIAVLGQSGISGGTGVAGRFENVNSGNSTNTLEVATNGIGNGIDINMPNASSGGAGININIAGVGKGVFATTSGGFAGVHGITGTISGAGVIGDNTFGEAVVGRNRGGNGVGAVVGRNDSSGYGVRGFNTKTGIGVLGQAGISGSTGNAGRFENVNAANGNDVFVIAGNGTGTSLLVVNANAGATNLAVFQKSGVGNVARIDDAGKVFANGGFQASGADVAEYFSVEGRRNSYEPGDVLVISQSSDRTVERSSTPYSTLVSGVYATKPGIALSEENINTNLDAKVPMGVIGVIPTKVCLEGGTIKRGDLLVTSSLTGVAMKADLDKVRVGQVLGKALQDYSGSEVGIIKVLVSVK